MRILVIAILAAALVAVADAPSATSKASVRIAKRTPVTIVGTGFQPRERVHIRVFPAGRPAYGKVVTASVAGRVNAVFAARSLSECISVRLTAVGNEGTRATGREIPPPGACGIDEQP